MIARGLVGLCTLLLAIAGLALVVAGLVLLRGLVDHALVVGLILGPIAILAGGLALVGAATIHCRKRPAFGQRASGRRTDPRRR